MGLENKKSKYHKTPSFWQTVSQYYTFWFFLSLNPYSWTKPYRKTLNLSVNDANRETQEVLLYSSYLSYLKVHPSKVRIIKSC